MSGAVKAVVAILAVGAVGLAGWQALEDRRVREEMEALRGELRASRRAVDECRVEVSREEMLFVEYDERVDSLRRRVRTYEGLESGGVPADSYDVYMDAFERYNAAVPAWRERADSLQAHWGACRDLIEKHNALADSFRTRLVELELADPPEEADAIEAVDSVPGADRGTDAPDGADGTEAGGAEGDGP